VAFEKRVEMILYASSPSWACLTLIPETVDELLSMRPQPWNGGHAGMLSQIWWRRTCGRAVQSTAEYIVNCVRGYRQVHVGLSFGSARNVRRQ
jgi:hypothetical protein